MTKYNIMYFKHLGRFDGQFNDYPVVLKSIKIKLIQEDYLFKSTTTKKTIITDNIISPLCSI